MYKDELVEVEGRRGPGRVRHLQQPARLPRGGRHGLRGHRGRRDQRHPRPPGAHRRRGPRGDRHLGRELPAERREPVVLSAALFDFDGTLVDTTEMIFQSMRHATSSVLGRDDFSREELLANVGQPLPRQMEVFDAEKRRAAPRGLPRPPRGAPRRPDRRVPRRGRGPRASASAGVRVVVVTSKRRRSVEMALEKFPGLDLVVDRFVTMEDTDEAQARPRTPPQGPRAPRRRPQGEGRLRRRLPLRRAGREGRRPHERRRELGRLLRGHRCAEPDHRPT